MNIKLKEILTLPFEEIKKQPKEVLDYIKEVSPRYFDEGNTDWLRELCISRISKEQLEKEFPNMNGTEDRQTKVASFLMRKLAESWNNISPHYAESINFGGDRYAKGFDQLDTKARPYYAAQNGMTASQLEKGYSKVIPKVTPKPLGWRGRITKAWKSPLGKGGVGAVSALGLYGLHRYLQGNAMEQAQIQEQERLRNMGVLGRMFYR